MAILCDGKSFIFYRFVNKRPADGSPQFFLGVFPNGNTGISIVDITLQEDVDAEMYYRRLRRICDALYYVFLSGYQSGLEAFWNRSVEKGRAQGKGRLSTPGWNKAKILAQKALEEAVHAWNLYDEGKRKESRKSGERAAQFLAERYVARCPSLVVVSANNECLFIAPRKLLFGRQQLYPLSPKRWRIYEISQGNTARLILLTQSITIRSVYGQVTLTRNYIREIYGAHLDCCPWARFGLNMILSHDQLC
jgi:hypothetical protein